MEIAEYVLAGLAALSASYILFTNHILYAAFSLIITLLALAVLYLMLGAEFVAATQIMIYVGGIIVLIIFGVMLTNEQGNAPPKTGIHNIFWGLIVSMGIFTVLALSLTSLDLKQSYEAVSILDLGRGMLTKYLIPFELAGILLLLALIGSSVVAAQKKDRA